jgi:guanosine-3',5'-bis(diphosphate) 3'-pyrophosphohydrolase
LGFAINLALLHDVLEDTPCQMEELQEKFGKAVADGVNALTKNESLEKSLRMSDSLERILASPPEVGMVKLADRITNLQPPPSAWTQEKIRSYYVEAELIFNTLGHLNAALSERMKDQMAFYQSFF